ncbi:bZIP transcription factor [Histoplasma ohiense]|nr:bZIP transcription factor [Histoplasma ohiense (nom. inval.)]
MSSQHALAPAPHPQMQDLKNQVQDHADQVLHDQLLAAQAQHLHQSHPHPHTHAHHAPPPPRPTPGASAASVRDPNNTNNANTANITIDPAIAGASAMIHSPPTTVATTAQGHAPDLPMEDHADGRKTYGKRELSTSKRAAQNRAAQRAFRQRKEGYIRKLEEQVKDYEILVENYKAIQAENYQLREYIISLQSRLIDSQNEVPELPGNIDLSQPRNDPPAPAINSSTTAGVTAGNAAETAGGGGGASAGDQAEVSALNRIAVAGLGMRKHQHEEAAFLGNNGESSGNHANVGAGVNNGNVNVNAEADSPSKRMRFDGLPDVEIGVGVGIGDGVKGEVAS